MELLSKIIEIFLTFLMVLGIVAVCALPEILIFIVILHFVSKYW